MIDNADAAAAAPVYVEFIVRHKWDWFCHLTLPRPRSRDFSTNKVRAWINQLNRKIFGNNYWKRGQGVQWVRSTEQQERGAYHFHLLIAGCEDLDIDYAVERWARLSGDTLRLGYSAKIQVYDASYGDKAADYLVKHNTDGDLDFGGPWPQLDLAEINQLNATR